jgi:hypothetical protein
VQIYEKFSDYQTFTQEKNHKQSVFMAQKLGFFDDFFVTL